MSTAPEMVVPGGGAAEHLHLDRTVLERALRVRGLGPLTLSRLSGVPLGDVNRAVRGKASRETASRLARVLGTTADALLDGEEEVQLDPVRVEVARHGRSLREIAEGSGGTLSTGAVGRAAHGEPIRRGLARHLAAALGMALDDLLPSSEVSGGAGAGDRRGGRVVRPPSLTDSH